MAMEQRGEQLNPFGFFKVATEEAKLKTQGEATTLTTNCHLCSLTLRSLPPVFQTIM